MTEALVTFVLYYDRCTKYHEVIIEVLLRRNGKVSHQYLITKSFIPELYAYSYLTLLTRCIKAGIPIGNDPHI